MNDLPTDFRFLFCPIPCLITIQYSTARCDALRCDAMRYKLERKHTGSILRSKTWGGNLGRWFGGYQAGESKMDKVKVKRKDPSI